MAGDGPGGGVGARTFSCLCPGHLRQQRLGPSAPRVTYDRSALLIDLDELPRLGLRLLSHNRANLFSVHDADLGAGSGDPRAWIAGHLAAAGIQADGPVRVHLFPRVLGFGFTPLTTWFCHDGSGDLAAVSAAAE